MPLLFRAVFLFVALLLPAGLAGGAPTVTDPSVIPAGSGGATLSGKVTANGANTTTVFRYGLDTKYGSNKPLSVESTAVDTVVSVNLTGLIGGQTYHYRIFVTNADGSASTSDQTFVEAAYPPTLTLGTPEKLLGGKATLVANVTANGTPGSMFFQYGLTNGQIVSYGSQSPAEALDASAVGKKISAPLTGLARGASYNYRFVFQDRANVMTVTANSTFSTLNHVPVPKADTFSLPALTATLLDVLKNDTDADGDPLIILSNTQPEHGLAVRTGNKITYTPGAGFTGRDTFSYTVEDQFGGSATATVTVRSLKASLAGTHGGLVTKGGTVVGYFRFTSTADGAFTGSVLIDGKKFTLGGAFPADGRFTGLAFSGGDSIAVGLDATQSSGGTSVSADFDGGKWASKIDFTEAPVATREKLAGRYTVELPTAASVAGATGSSTAAQAAVPGGTGWATILVLEDGLARIKGRLADGRSFSTPGVLNVGADGGVVTFFDDPSQTRVIGSFKLGDTVTGTMRVDRGRSDDERFPAGYDITHTVTGARYEPPAKGASAFAGGNRKPTITFSGGGFGSNLSHELRVTLNDKVQVLDPGRDELSVKIDRGSGRFQTRMNLDSAGRQLKGTGVLIQGAGVTGAGVFSGETQTGKIEISPVSAAPNPNPNPNPTPVVTP